MAAPSPSSESAGYAHAYAPERAKIIWKAHSAKLIEKAFEYIAQRISLERAGLRGLQKIFPGINSDDLVQKWIDRLADGAATDMPDTVGDPIEETAIDTMKRAEQYLGHLQRSMVNEPRENCLDCTFCGAWFPTYWLLDITPQGIADWRNNYYKCCLQCVR